MFMMVDYVRKMTMKKCFMAIMDCLSIHSSCLVSFLSHDSCFTAVKNFLFVSAQKCDNPHGVWLYKIKYAGGVTL